MPTATVTLNGEFYCSHTTEDLDAAVASAQHHAEAVKKREARRAKMLKVRNLTCVEIRLSP